MNSCPNCGKPVDALRSRHVGVRAGKVVAYCSAECLAAQETRPTAIPKGMTPSVETGPVIEVVKAPGSGPIAASPSNPSKKKKPKTEPVPVVVPVVVAAPAPAPPKRDSEPMAEWAKNAELMKQGDATRTARPRRGLVTALFVVVVAAVAALVAYKFIFVGKATSATSTEAPPPPVAKVEPAPPPVAPEPPPPPPITIPEALDRAKAALAKDLRADSPRVQRLAAGALERGVDRASAELLVAALKNETSDPAKLELAYALARGGDARGTSVLVQALMSTPPDPKHWAAERLVRLAIGEPDAKKPETAKAAEVLAASLDVAQHRLLSGELLARLGDPRGTKALDAIRADAQATPEAKATAAIALGLAGRADVAPALHELLADGNARPLAAAALAHLHDATARPVLVEQLAAPGHRVRAARALRELEPALDPVPLLAPLLAALASSTGAEQVEAGEAVLVLCGPAAWSARE